MNNFTDNTGKPFSDAGCPFSREAIGARLREARNALGLTMQQAADLDGVNINRNTLQQWETGATEASIAAVSRLARAYGVDPVYLLSGLSPGISTPTPNDDDYVYIAAYDIEASAGHGMFTDGATTPDRYLAFRRQWVRERGFDAKQLAAIFTKGDSMTPTVPDGATIVVDLRHRVPVDGKIFVIRIGDRLWIKRTRWIPTGALRLISDNPDYEPFDIPRAELNHDDFEVCGQVVNASFDLY